MLQRQLAVDDASPMMVATGLTNGAADHALGREDQPAASPNPAHVATQRLADRLKSDGGGARYRRRKAIVEPVIGWIKEVLGFRRFSLRGEAKTRGEWNVVCLAGHLKRFHRITMA
jgi:hypothetical protein